MGFNKSSRNPSGKGMLRRNKSHQAGVIQNYKKFATKTFAGKRRFPKKKCARAVIDAGDDEDESDTSTKEASAPTMTSVEQYVAEYEAQLMHSGRAGGDVVDELRQSTLVKRREKEMKANRKVRHQDAGREQALRHIDQVDDSVKSAKVKKGHGRIHGAITQRQQLKKEQQEHERALHTAKVEREKMLKDKQARKKTQAKKLNMRTKRGQPIMSFHMDNLLAKIQKGK
eukprot:m.369601 g.369601  ORF g.369601 m.369601 type:complete len:228 (+) comp20853_c0_seq4:253-936(+)